MNAEASSSSHIQEHTYLDSTATKSDPTVDQPPPHTKGLEVEDTITLLEVIIDQSQPPSEFETITLEAKLAKKNKQLIAARQELRKIEGEKTKLKQEVSPQRQHKLISGRSR